VVVTVTTTFKSGGDMSPPSQSCAYDLPTDIKTTKSFPSIKHKLQM